MTESEWLVSGDPQAMLRLFGGTLALRVSGGHIRRQPEFQISDRKLRLWCAACYLMSGNDPNDPHVVWWWDEWAESPTHNPNMTVEQGVRLWLDNDLGPPDAPTKAALLRDIAGNPFRPVTLPLVSHSYRGDVLVCGRWHKDAPLTKNVCPWLTPTVVSLARAAYEERPGRKCGLCKGTGEIAVKNFNLSWEDADCPDCHGDGRVEDGTLCPVRLAVLADALEEAGYCDEECQRCRGAGYGFGMREYGSEDLPRHGCSGCGGQGVWWPSRTKSQQVGDWRQGAGRVPHPLLAHLRSPGMHVPGCWAIDLLLGKG